MVDGSALALCLFGDTASWFSFPGRWTIGGLSPLFLAGVLLLVGRHVVWPRPSLPGELLRVLRTYLSQRSARTAWKTTALTRLAVLVAGIVAVVAVPPERQSGQSRISANPIYDLPYRWDAAWYANIARAGYAWRPDHAEEQQNIAFFPAYPIAMRIAGDVLTTAAKIVRDPLLLGGGDGRILWGGVLVSILCFGFGLRHVQALTLLDTGDAGLATRATLLLATYPFALFFSAAYSEGLALLALSGAVLAWRQGDLGRAIGWGLLAGLARSNGWALTIALLCGWTAERNRSPKWVLAVAAPIAGVSAYSVYTYRLTGDPFSWTHAQRAWVGDIHPLEFITRRRDLVAEHGLLGYVAADRVDAVSGVAVLFMGALAVYLAARRRWMYAALIAAYLAPAVVLDLAATGRITAVLFPAFIALACLCSRAAAMFVCALFMLGQLWLAYRFFQWQTPF